MKLRKALEAHFGERQQVPTVTGAWPMAYIRTKLESALLAISLTAKLPKHPASVVVDFRKRVLAKCLAHGREFGVAALGSGPASCLRHHSSVAPLRAGRAR